MLLSHAGVIIRTRESFVKRFRHQLERKIKERDVDRFLPCIYDRCKKRVSSDLHMLESTHKTLINSSITLQNLIIFRFLMIFLD